jgi:hypothetical protein
MKSINIILNIFTFKRSEMNVHPSAGGVPRFESKASKNYVQLSFISSSTAANANGYI